MVSQVSPVSSSTTAKTYNGDIIWMNLFVLRKTKEFGQRPALCDALTAGHQIPNFLDIQRIGATLCSKI